MSKGLITKTILSDIADAIRGKTGSTAQIKPSEMAGMIEAISGGGNVAGIEICEHYDASAENSRIVLSHSLGAKPSYAFIIGMEPHGSIPAFKMRTSLIWPTSSGETSFTASNVRASSDGASYTIGTQNSATFEATADSVAINVGTNFAKGVHYYIILVAIG